MNQNNALKWLLRGFLGGLVLAGCASQPFQYKPERIYHGPSLWCDLGEKGLKERCVEPTEVKLEIEDDRL